MKGLRALSLDASDRLVFARAAAPGQWVVSGAFLFDPQALETMSPKERIALRSGFLGIDDLGFSTLAVVSPMSALERDAAIAGLAAAFKAKLGAPEEEALGVARSEIDFAIGLADHPIGAVIGVHREARDGALRERFRLLSAREAANDASDGLHAHARAFLAIETESGATEERIDLATLAGQDGS